MCFSTTLKLSLNRRSSIKNWLSWVLGNDTTFFCCNSGRSRGSVDVKYLALTHIFTIVCMRVRSTLFCRCIFSSRHHTHIFFVDFFQVAKIIEPAVESDELAYTILCRRWLWLKWKLSRLGYEVKRDYKDILKWFFIVNCIFINDVVVVIAYLWIAFL